MYRLTDVLSLFVGLSAPAVDTLTSDETNVADEAEIVIGPITYRIIDEPVQAYDVQRDADADETLENLIAAINASGTEGVEYFEGTLIHPSVSAAALSSHASVMTAKLFGFGGNDIVATGATHLTFGTPKFAGGKGGLLAEANIETAGVYTTEAIDVSSYSELIAFLTAHDIIGATGTLDVKFQISPDAVNWVDAGDAFVQVTTGETTTIKKLTANFGKFLRAVVTTAGTDPVFNISLQLVGKN